MPLRKRRRDRSRRRSSLSALQINVGHHAFHQPSRGWWNEAETPIKIVRIPRGQKPSPQTLQLRMGENSFHHAPRQAAPAMRCQYKDIRQIGKSCPVRHDTCKSHLPLCFVIDRKAERVRNRLADDVERHALRPVTFTAQPTVNERNVDACRIGSDDVTRVSAQSLISPALTRSWSSFVRRTYWDVTGSRRYSGSFTAEGS